MALTRKYSRIMLRGHPTVKIYSSRTRGWDPVTGEDMYLEW